MPVPSHHLFYKFNVPAKLSSACCKCFYGLHLRVKFRKSQYHKHYFQNNCWTKFVVLYFYEIVFITVKVFDWILTNLNHFTIKQKSNFCNINVWNVLGTNANKIGVKIFTSGHCLICESHGKIYYKVEIILFIFFHNSFLLNTILYLLFRK